MNEFFTKNSVKGAIAPQSHLPSAFKLLLVSILLLIFIGSVHAELTDGLVSYYNFDETSGTIATDLRGLNDLTITNLNINQTGLIEKAYSASTGTSDRKALKTSASNMPTTAFSLSIWYKMSGLAGYENPEIINLTGGTINTIIWNWEADASEGITFNLDVTSYVSNIKVDDGDWHHLVLTYNGSTIKGYIDNVERISQNVSKTINSTQIKIGPATQRTETTQYYDEAGIWSRALTSNEVTKLYNSGFGLTYPFGVTAVFADFDYVVTGTQVDLNDTSSVSGNAIINSWEWLIDDLSVSTDQNYSFAGVEATDYNVCLIIQDTTLSLEDSTCQTISISDLTPPVTTFSYEQISGTTDANITLTCTDNNSGCKTLNYNINNEGWNIIQDIIIKNMGLSSSSGTGTSWKTGPTNTLNLDDLHPIDTEVEMLSGQLCIRGEYNFTPVSAYVRYNYSDSTTSNSNTISATGNSITCHDLTTKSNPAKTLVSTTIFHKASTDNHHYVTGGNIEYTYKMNTFTDVYPFIYSGAGDHNIQFYSTDNADNNEAIKLSYFPMFKSENEPSNSRIKLTGVTNYNGYTITSWLYQVNGTPLSGTTDRIKYYSTQSNQDLNVCLTTNNTDTICQNVFTWDTINPIIDANIKTSGYGFTNTFDINYNLTCNDNFPFITYKVIWTNNGTTITIDEQYLATETLLQGTLDLNAGQEATLTFTCTDASNNQATYTAPTQYAIQFNIVDETTGLPFDLTKVTHAQAYTYDGNYLFNFKDTNNATQTYWSPTSVIRFDFTYPDEAQTKISREINFDYIDDANVPVCAAEYQQFYLYRFLSTTEKPIILYNDFANCYSLASTTKFLWTTYLTNTAYTINKPYYLYTYSNGVKSLLAILDGANNTEINLDILQFNQAQYQFDVASDSIVFRPGENDSNTIVFYFFSPNNNTWVNLEIYDQANNLLWDYLENTDTNSFQVTFFYGDLDINSDDLLKIVVTVLNDGDTTTFFKYFNTKGEAYAGLLNPIVAIVLSFFVLFFGITMVSYRFAMGWFGIVISFLAIGILALAPLYDYVLFLMAIYFIIGLFIGLIGREQTLGVN